MVHTFIVAFLFHIGAGFGLAITLNIEQYEYLPGPNTDAGIKVKILCSSTHNCSSKGVCP